MNDFFKKPLVKVLMMKGEAGSDIKNIQKTSTSGLKDTYTIYLDNGKSHTFSVTNGKGITKIEKTGTSGLTDTYTITYNDGTTSTFETTNGKDGGLTAEAENRLKREYIRTITDLEVTEGSDLNDMKYLNIGTYTCPLADRIPSLSNLPEEKPFIMIVLAPLGGTYGEEGSLAWLYRVRFFITYLGNVYVQAVHSENTATMIFSSWVRFTTSADFASITNSEIDTILNS